MTELCPDQGAGLPEVPEELVQQWLGEFHAPCPAPGLRPGEAALHIATTAARWNADQELKACCEWLDSQHHSTTWSSRLRAARRPKPPSETDQALAVIDLIQGNSKGWQLNELDVVRAALQRLRELERGDG